MKILKKWKFFFFLSSQVELKEMSGFDERFVYFVNFHEYKS